MQLGRVNEYSFLNAKIRALKSKILTYDVIENLLSADSMIEIGRQIGDQFPTATEFLKGSITDPIQIEDALRTDFNSSIQKVVKYAPKATQPFLFHYLRRDFYLYMKHIVRQLDAQESTHELQPRLLLGSYQDSATLLSLKEAGSIDQLPRFILDIDLRTKIEQAMPEFIRLGSTLPIEAKIDEVFFYKLWKYLKELSMSERDIALQIVGSEIDLTNLVILFRAKKFELTKLETRQFLIPIKGYLGSKIDLLLDAISISQMWEIIKSTRYRDLSVQMENATEKVASFYELERYKDQFMVHQAFKLFSMDPFQIGIILAYFVLKDQETRNLRAIIQGKMDKISPEKIREVLTIF